MKAVLFEKFQTPPKVLNVEDPTPDAQGVVLKVEATGVCRSDWHGWMGHDSDIELPHIPGGHRRSRGQRCQKLESWRPRHSSVHLRLRIM